MTANTKVISIAAYLQRQQPSPADQSAEVYWPEVEQLHAQAMQQLMQDKAETLDKLKHTITQAAQLPKGSQAQQQMQAELQQLLDALQPLTPPPSD